MVRGRDGIIRRVIVRYRNFKEEFDRFTDRSVRRLVKLYSADDPDLQYDLVKVQARTDQLLESGGQADTTAVIMDAVMENSRQGDDSRVPVSKSARLLEKCQCCCKEHCKVLLHNYYKTQTFVQAIPTIEEHMIEVFNIDEVLYEEVEEVEEIGDNDNFTTYIMGIGLNLA